MDDVFLVVIGRVDLQIGFDDDEDKMRGKLMEGGPLIQGRPRRGMPL